MGFIDFTLRKVATSHPLTNPRICFNTTKEALEFLENLVVVRAAASAAVGPNGRGDVVFQDLAPPDLSSVGGGGYGRTSCITAIFLYLIDDITVISPSVSNAL